MSKSSIEFIWGTIFLITGTILQFMPKKKNESNHFILSNLPGTGRFLLIFGAGFVIYGMYLRSKEKRNGHK
ncbi:hypothetical protein DX130_14275 [Paenibacillus paeoniae]|uniref:Uncharacterized protein n=1 Tax=Paenibacillus paeoniae TaxID=2292705 RepID=A0A371PFT9_9BACL|nr:hypothetical protein DX130_14275 [Paenibacillus paeoniae]